MPAKKRIRYAVVGLGHIAQVAVLPAFEHASRNSELVALISSDEKKLRELGRRYDIDHLCSYEQYDELLGSGEVDAVFIALPNSHHRSRSRKRSMRARRRKIDVLPHLGDAPATLAVLS
jgi:predicted dehydrogenase